MDTPPYVLLGNGKVALRFLEAMEIRYSSPKCVILNSRNKQRSAKSIRGLCYRARVDVHEWSSVTRATLLERIRSGPPLWILSVYFGHIVDEEVLDAVDGRAINLHPSLLPWCRGVHTNVWPIVERTPAGVTLHVMRPKVDAGPILAQGEVAVEVWDTGKSLYEKLEDRAVQLLAECWPSIVMARWPGSQQSLGGSEHHLHDFETLESYDVNRHPDVRQFFDLLRARSFDPHAGLQLKLGDDVVEATLSLRKASHD